MFLLQFIYTDQIDGEKIKDFLDLAISFGFTNLPQELLKSAKADRLTKDNVVCMLQIANYCQDPVLKNGCLEFIMRYLFYYVQNILVESIDNVIFIYVEMQINYFNTRVYWKYQNQIWTC